jgi:hypothetical protein
MQWYQKTRFNKKRIAATERGKEIVSEFIKLAIERIKIEHPEENYKDSKVVALTSLFLFIKYVINEKVDLLTGKNSEIHLFVKFSDGDTLYTHNLLTDKAYTEYRKKEETHIKRMYEVIKAVEDEGDK